MHLRAGRPTVRSRLAAQGRTSALFARRLHQAWLRNLLENYPELKAKGVTPYWCIHHGLTASLHYADPDGNQMEFQVDAFADDGCNAFIQGEQMAVNPVGVAAYTAGLECQSWRAERNPSRRTVAT